MSDQQVFLQRMNVSRETLSRLECFADMLEKWTKKINLVSKGSLESLWSRHILDSAQLLSYATPVKAWVDLGSGGGFPGVIVAIILADKDSATKVTLIESDQRKAAFLRAALREVGVKGNVVTSRIESAQPQRAEILSARALAPLSDLLEYTDRHLNPKGMALLHKGENWRHEVEQARQRWRFDLTPHTSLSDPSAAILQIQGIEHV